MQVLKLLLHKLRWTPLPFSQCYSIHKSLMTSVHFLTSCILQRGNQSLPTICYHTKTHGSPPAIDMSLIFHQLVHDRKWHHKVICITLCFFVSLFLCSAWLSHCSHCVSALSSTSAISIENTHILYNCILRCWLSGWKTRSNPAPSISRWSKLHLCSDYIIAAKKLTWKHAYSNHYWSSYLPGMSCFMSLPWVLSASFNYR